MINEQLFPLNEVPGKLVRTVAAVRDAKQAA